MNQLKFVLLAATLIGSSIAQADVNPLRDSTKHPDVVSTGRALETSSDITLLPVSENGRVTVNNCSGCRAITVSANADTVYYIGRAPVTLGQLKAYVADGRAHPMSVVISDKKNLALRIGVAALPGRQLPSR